MSNAQKHPKVAPRTHTNFICNIQKAWNRQNKQTRGWKEAKQSNTWTPLLWNRTWRTENNVMQLHPPANGICRSITKSVSKGLSRIFFHQKITALSQPCHKLTISADTLFRGDIGHVISVPQGMRVRYRTHEWREQYPNLQHCLQSTYELSPCITSLRGNKEYIDLWPGSGSNLIQDSCYWLDTNFLFF